MGILYALLFAGILRDKKINAKRTSIKLKKECKFWFQLIKELVQLMNIIFKFIFTGLSMIINKSICQSETVQQVKNEKVIDLAEYRLKKAK